MYFQGILYLLTYNIKTLWFYISIFFLPDLCAIIFLYFMLSTPTLLLLFLFKQSFIFYKRLKIFKFYTCTQVAIISDVAYFHLILFSFFLGASFNISCGVGLMVTYSFNLRKSLFSLSFLKDIFISYRFLAWHFFSFITLKISFHCFLAYTAFDEKFDIILCSSKFIVSVLCFKIFLFITGFKLSDYGVP